jgi:hypothetical protein
MSNFIHTTNEKHHPVDIDCIATIHHRIRSDSYEHTITFITKEGKEICVWYFNNTNEIEFLKETFKNIKQFIESTNINNIVKL